MGAAVAVGISVGVALNLAPLASNGARVARAAGCDDGLSQPEINMAIRISSDANSGYLEEVMADVLGWWMWLCQPNRGTDTAGQQ